MIRSNQVWAFLILALVYIVGVPFIVESRYILGILASAAGLSIIALGAWLTLAIGRVNLGQGAFALVGGYVVAIATTRWGVSFWLAIVVAGFISAAVGVVLGLGILRLRGVYFAMITLSFTEAVRLALLNGGEFTGGAGGISRIPVPGELSLLGVTIIPAFNSVNTHVASFVLSGVLLALAVLLCWRISACRIGGVFVSMQQSEELAQSVGVNITHLRIVAFGIGSFLGGIGGGYFAAAQQSVYPGGVGVSGSVSLGPYCFLGGLGYVAGPVVGTFLLFLGFQFLQDFQQYQMLAYSLLMVALMIWLPNGVLSLSEAGWIRRYRSQHGQAGAHHAG